MEVSYTRHQVARGSRPDATVGDTWYLLKNPGFLRLTYQIRLLAFLASQQRAQLVIRVPKGTGLLDPLRAFVSNSRVARVEVV